MGRAQIRKNECTCEKVSICCWKAWIHFSPYSTSTKEQRMGGSVVVSHVCSYLAPILNTVLIRSSLKRARTWYLVWIKDHFSSLDLHSLSLSVSLPTRPPYKFELLSMPRKHFPLCLENPRKKRNHIIQAFIARLRSLDSGFRIQESEVRSQESRVRGQGSVGVRGP